MKNFCSVACWGCVQGKLHEKLQIAFLLSQEAEQSKEGLRRLPWLSKNELKMDPLITAPSENNQIHLKNEHLHSRFLAMAKPVQFLLKDQQTWVEALQMRSGYVFEEHHLPEGVSALRRAIRPAKHGAAGIVQDRHRIQMRGSGGLGRAGLWHHIQEEICGQHSSRPYVSTSRLGAYWLLSS